MKRRTPLWSLEMERTAHVVEITLFFTCAQDLCWFSFLVRVHAVHEIYDKNQQEGLYLTYSFVYQLNYFDLV